MHLDIPQKIVGHVNQEWIDSLQKFLLENDEDWYADDYRKGAENVATSDTIPLRHSYRCGGPYAHNNTEWNSPNLDYRSVKNRILHDKYEPYIRPFLNKIKEIYPNGTEYMYMLTRLAPGAKIGGHTDNGIFARCCHRVHIPIQTHPEVEYLIAEYTDEKSNYGEGLITPYYWSTGNIYEFSNERWHAVHNNSDVNRIHLIFNVYNFSEEIKNLDAILENDKEQYNKVINDIIHYYTYISNGIDRI